MQCEAKLAILSIMVSVPPYCTGSHLFPLYSQHEHPLHASDHQTHMANQMWHKVLMMSSYQEHCSFSTTMLLLNPISEHLAKEDGSLFPPYVVYKLLIVYQLLVMNFPPVPESKLVHPF